MVFELFQWWYGAGWKKATNSIIQYTNSVSHTFSVPILLKTLFAPWRKIGSIGGKTLEQKVQASVDNSISRLVGFTTRLLVLIAAGLIMLLGSVGAVLLAIIWPLLPLAIIFCLVKGITG